MKHLRFQLFAVLLCLLCGNVYAANVLRVDSVRYPAGKTVSLPIILENSSDITGVQFDISVPYELETDASGNVIVQLSKTRAASHVYTTKSLGTENRNASTHGGVSTYHKYRIIVYNDQNALLLDNVGVLLTVNLTTSIELKNGAVLPIYLLDKSVTLSNREKQNVLTSQANGAITIEEIPRPDLTPVNVTFDGTSVNPGDKFKVSWVVKNIGQVSTDDGWSEQISLFTVSGNLVKTIATTYYDKKLSAGSQVSRNAEIQLPTLLGLDGACKVQVTIVPTEKTGEHISLRDNNIAQSAKNISVGKMLTLELSQLRVVEGSNQRITAKLSRSGRWNNVRTFTISSTPTDSRLELPTTVSIPMNQSGTVFYINVGNNSKVDNDSIVTLSIEGDNYKAATARIVIEDDEFPELAVKSSKSVITEGESFDLTITTSRVSSEPIAVSITSENNKRFKFPSQVTIPAGKNSVTVSVQTVDDELPNLEESNKFTVSAAHFNRGEVIVLLQDNDMPVLSLTLTPDKVGEDAGPTAVSAVLTRTGNTDSKITIKLSDDSNGGLYYSNKSIVMEKGVETTYFNLGPVENTLQDGDRVYTLNAGIWISSCNCAASGESAGSVSAKLTVLDNDGAALSLSSQSGTVKEGGETVITVSRNTVADISKALTVTLSSNYDAELEYTKTVVIPSGQTSAQVTVKSKKNSTPDDSHTVIFTVSSNGYASGTCFLLVTDQTLPDAHAVNLTTDVSEAMIGTTITVSVNITNDGAFPLPANTPVMFYLKGNADAIGTSYIEQEIPVGGSAMVNRIITLPESVNEYTYYAVVNAQRTVSELVYTNNTSNEVTVKALSPFTAKVETDKEVYRQGDIIRISGQLTGQKTTNEMIDVYIINEGVREVKQVKTDAAGKFTLDWQLFDLQTGHFAVGACFKDEQTREEMASFDVYGLRRTETGYITCEVTCGEAYNGIIPLVNAGKLPLSGVTAKVVNAPEGCEASLNLPQNIGANETVNMLYTLNGSTASPGKDWEPLKVQVTSNEGAFLEVTLYYYARTAQGNLVVENQNLITTMNKDDGRDYSFIVINNGKGNTGKISLSLPSWMTPLTGATMPGLNQKDTATVMLRMMPTDDMQLNVPVTGMLGINCENGNGTFINFNITPVSDKTGTLVVDVTDEYTYYTDEKPHVKGAEVVLKNPVTGAIVSQGLSDENGLFTIELPEGYYQLNVTADKHDSYKNNVLVDPGITTNKVICLSYQAVSVSWDVEETEIEDEYNIVTTVKYETNVPAPVVEVIEPNSLDVGQLGVGESLIYYAVLTNKGLINANGTSYIIPEMAGDCKLEPLVEYTNLTLLPQQSYTIPVKLTRLSREESTHTIHGGSGSNTTHTQWLWDYSPNVTAPVVQVTEPDNMDIGNFNVGQSTTYTVVLTNTGSVPVKDVSYTVPIISGNYKWKPTSENLGLTIEPQESATITVEITLLDSEEAANVAAGIPSQSSSSTKNGRCKISTVTDYYWECGPDKKWGWYPHEIKLVPPIDCPSSGGRGLWTIYGHGLGSPGGDDGGGSYSSHDNFNGVSFSAECNPCLVNLSSFILDATDCAAVNFTPFIGCGYGIGRSIQGALNIWYNGTTSDWVLWWAGTINTGVSCFFPQLGPITGAIGCGLALIDIANGCGEHTIFAKGLRAVQEKNTIPSWLDAYKERTSCARDYFVALKGYIDETFGNPKWGEVVTSEETQLLFDAIEKAVGNKKEISVETMRANKPMDITNNEFNTFIERVNNSLLYAGTETKVDNMINVDLLYSYLVIMQKSDSIAKTYGYQGVGDLMDKEYEALTKKVQEDHSSTCATISLQIDQTMTMTRQAFRGTLTVTNGSKEQPMTDVKLKLNVTNTQTGLTATAKEFEMHTEKLQMFNGDLDMESGWYLGADSTGTATILFIPSKYAAPTEPVDYSFGGTLSYVDPYTGLEVTRELYPVTLTVKPSPELDLTYFMQRDIYGDDALTDAVEPMVPGEFAVILNNKGYGDATNVRMVTQQPKIIENEKGLYINFEFLSSQLNGQDKTLAMGESIPTEFGTIPAHSQAYAQWWLQSTLLGHFVEYNIEATHVTSYGNENLSLLDQVTIHELIHGFTPTDKGGRAFLVNDISDIDDLPDQVYFTDATQEDVSIAVNAVATKQSDTEYTLEIVPLKGGWNYGNVLDPTVGRQKLIKVVRQRDNKELPLDNVWQTDRTLIDGKDWHYENRLHFVGDMVAVGETYLLTFEPKPDVELEVERFDGVPTEGTLSLQRITEVTVTFNKAIDVNSFTTSDLALACQGTPLDASKIAITKVDDRTFKLSFTALSTQNGYYVLTVQTAEITDAEGFRGATGKQATWIQFADGKVVLAINASPENGGKVTPASGQYEYEKPITLTATPNEGFGFVNWVTNGVTVVSDQPSLEYIPKQDATLTAVFQPKNVNVTVNFREDAGTIEGGGTGIYAYGTELTLKATPVDGFQFDGWMIDSVKVAGSPDANTLTFNVTKPVQVDAIFSVRPDIILSGRVTSSADNTPIAGATITLTHDDMVYTTTTDRFGRYSLQIDDRSLTYAVHCEATGYIWSANDDIWFDETAKTKDFVLLRGESVVVPSDGIFAFSPNVDVKVEDLDVTVWYVTEFDNTSFVMKQVTSGTIKAGEGIIIVGTSQERLDMLAVKDAPEIPNNLLIGTGRIPYEVKDDNVFILNEGTDSRRFRAQATTDTYFYRAAKGTVIPEGKAYIHYTLSDLPDEVGIIWDDTSLIKIVKQAMEGEEKHFGLDGRRIYKIDKGLHILKGRKVIVK